MALPTLDDPFYYLANFRRVLDWLTARYADLLTAHERDFIERFDTLPWTSQALLVRLVMRKGIDFRLGRLQYAEIGETAVAVEPLIEQGWVEEGVPLTLEALFALTTRPELDVDLRAWLAGLGLGRSSGKGAWLNALQVESPSPRPLAQWLPSLGDRHLRLTIDALCERFRLMFFGNLRQQWSEFVLAELGIYRFERVALEADSRAFSRREELEAYHHLHACRERLDADEPLATLLPDVPLDAFDNAWLERRRGRLVHKIAYRCERQGDLDQARRLYEASSAPESRLRRVRVLEAQDRIADALALGEQALASPGYDAEQQALARILPRLRRKLGGAPVRRRKTAEPGRFDLELPPSSSVERAVARHLSQPGAPVFYVENTLINTLFGLLCWEAIFAPLPGAFFHPFHSGPADLFDVDFHARRRELFQRCLVALERGEHGEIIRRHRQEKCGIQSPFVVWEALDDTALELALTCIPPAHLRLWFERLLGDIRANRAGMPDLIQFMPEAGDGEIGYRMIEVKGPGDRLQDNQKRWLEFCALHEMPVNVCYVTWRADAPEGHSETASPGTGA
ncbi:VRR-NUC domain-containing protein [Salinicola avicenniae]|uniref:VRR-NUC domain-containing protein n=1 Tax=Salinicola avicenniae TaxID=2916836 RepID=UPI002072CA7F|nr:MULTISPECIES: VRR-NUC domain-containing protein [unclassified Salinicola]